MINYFMTIIINVTISYINFFMNIFSYKSIRY